MTPKYRCSSTSKPFTIQCVSIRRSNTSRPINSSENKRCRQLRNYISPVSASPGLSHYNRRVELSSISLIQLRESHSSRTREETTLRPPHRRRTLAPRVGNQSQSLSSQAAKTLATRSPPYPSRSHQRWDLSFVSTPTSRRAQAIAFSGVLHSPASTRST